MGLLNRRVIPAQKVSPLNEKKRFKAKQKVLGRSRNLIDLSWYHHWIGIQLQTIPQVLRSILVGGSPITEPAGFEALCLSIEKFTCQNEGCSIDEIVDQLILDQILPKKEFDDSARLRTLVFAVLGWRSMLYKPALNTCSFDQLEIIHEERDIESGLVYDNYRLPAHLSDRPLSILLKAFGNLLPARSVAATGAAAETSKMVASWMALWPQEINAYLLQVLLRVRFRWVDSLALHLDYDKSTRTLSLFAFPSFCASMLENQDPISAFASVEHHAVDPRADLDDIISLLREVLLSYRLLFGQTPKSRKVFRRISSQVSTLGAGPDTLLHLLCTSKQISTQSDESWLPEDRTVYFASKDFGVLYDRVELLAKELENVRPQSMGDLVRDRRDKLQYWTFWLISIIGGIGIVLSLAQVALQAFQVSQQCTGS